MDLKELNNTKAIIKAGDNPKHDFTLIFDKYQIHIDPVLDEKKLPALDFILIENNGNHN